LITALSEQRDIYIKLYGLSLQKRDAIEAQDLDRLNQIVKDEQPLLIQLSESERGRVKILGEFAPALKMPAEKISLQSIIEICPPSFVVPLKRIHIELSNALKSQMALNDVNRKLIESRLEYISFMMDTSSNEFNNAYNLTGSDTRTKPNGPRLIDLEV
jgi:hypothetical protein